MKTHLLLTLSTLALLCIASPQAHAQINLFGSEEEEEEEGPKVLNPYDDKYKADLKITAEEMESGSLTANYIYDINFVRKPFATQDDLSLFITSPGSIFGCLDIEQPTIETSQNGPALSLKITEGYIGPDTGTVRYFHHECTPQSGLSQTLITLSKQQLIKDGVKKLVIISEELGPFNNIALDIKKDRVITTSKVRDLSSYGLPIKGGTSKSIYWIYPENTIALFSSSADLRDKTVRENVKQLAIRRGLTPIEKIIPDFQPLFKNTDKLYVLDTIGRYNDKLTQPNDVFSFGQIEINELYFGANGSYDKPVEKTIFAKRPGLYE